VHGTQLHRTAKNCRLLHGETHNVAEALSGDGITVRGAEASFRIVGASVSDQISGWRFVPAESSFSPIVRQTRQTSRQWNGLMAISGTVKVTIRRAGVNHQLERAIVVVPWSWGPISASTSDDETS
jgi:hypothetical protein